MLREVKLLTQGHTAASSQWSWGLSRSLSDLEAGALGTARNLTDKSSCLTVYKRVNATVDHFRETSIRKERKQKRKLVPNMTEHDRQSFAD